MRDPSEIAFFFREERPSIATLGNMLEPLHGSFWGGVAAHAFMIPLWTLSPIPAVMGVVLILMGGLYSIIGAAFLVALTSLNTITFAYRPWFVKVFYDLDMTRYYRRCELRGALGSMRKESTLFMFHPHGILATGFVVNGCWSKPFNELTSEKDLNTPKHTGTVFLIAQSLREWSALFKVLCDCSGRLESATKKNITMLMRARRNLAIIPGGFEDATLHEYGKERTCMKPRKGLIKYALQNGYALTPIYSFGESGTYRTFTGLLSFRLQLNQWGIPGVLFWGEPLVPTFPRIDSQVLTYVGEPLQLPTIDLPTDEQVSNGLECLCSPSIAFEMVVGLPLMTSDDH